MRVVYCCIFLCKKFRSRWKHFGNIKFRKLQSPRTKYYKSNNKTNEKSFKSLATETQRSGVEGASRFVFIYIVIYSYVIKECKFALQIRSIYGDSLKKVVVYGSYARGDYQKNSDIDIMILVKANDEEIKKKFNSVCDLAFDYELEYGVVISPLVKNEEHFLKWSDALPFYRNVKMEGVIVDEI